MYNLLIVVIDGILLFRKVSMLERHDELVCGVQLGMELIILRLVDALQEGKLIVASF